MARQVQVLFDGKKSIPVWDVDSMVGWTAIGGSQPTGIDLYFSRVPWLYRGVVARADGVSSMPFAVVKGKRDFDTSQDYQNKLEFLPDPELLFDLIEQSLAMMGRAYVFLETNAYGVVKAAKFCSPSTVTEVRNEDTGVLEGYKRTYGKRGKVQEIKPRNMVAIYDPNYTVDDGPADVSAAKAALTAAGVLYNADRFIANYFERGAIKATILTVDGGNRDEAERLQTWWGDVVAGVKNAWSAIVLRMKGVVATVIGEGLESLQNNDMTTERRQDIATALGVPESKLWSSAANYATRVEDEKDWYNGTIIPECKTIARAFNTQLFTAEHKLEGYKLVFRHETLDVFQEDVNEQAQAAKSFVEFLKACNSEALAVATAAMIGFELSAEMKAAITAEFAEREKRAAEMQQQLAGNAPGQDQPGREDSQDDDEPEQPNPMREEMRKWERKALNALKRGKSAAVNFESDLIPASLSGAIQGQLEAAQNPTDLHKIFNAVIAWEGYP